MCIYIYWAYIFFFKKRIINTYTKLKQFKLLPIQLINQKITERQLDFALN